MNPDYQPPCSCGSCKPRLMLGTSWWKNLGFNTAHGNCAEELYPQGHRHIQDWACMHCTGNASIFTHYPKCEQCPEQTASISSTTNQEDE
jgi:hypothetical protein